MKKIRIGNDIRLKLTIDGIDNLTQSNIKQLRCYLVDTTFGKEEDEARKKHARRFTREVFPEYYIPSEYNMHCCEKPAYHVHPANVCHYDHFLPDFHDHHWWPGYCGFGLHPNKFERYHWHWHHWPLWPNLECSEHPFVDGPDRFHEPWFLAESEVLNETNTVTCMFPAESQHRCGIYKLVVVLTLFERGWGKHNLRTYTIDKGDVFELVDDASGESGNITITVDDSGNRDSVVSSIHSENYTYTLISGDVMHIGESDILKKIYNIYVDLKDKTRCVYNPYDWRFNELIFSSSDDALVYVDQYGTIYTHNLPDGVDQQEATVYVRNADDDDVTYEFKIIVKNASNALKIGFSTAETINSLDVESLTNYDANQTFDYTINNDEDGKYLWILSEREINNVESSGFYVPLKDAVTKDGFYAYRSAAAILEGDMKFVIKYKYYG